MTRNVLIDGGYKGAGGGSAQLSSQAVAFVTSETILLVMPIIKLYYEVIRFMK